MSVEFRQRKPGEYVKIAWKRKWLIILPAIAIATAVSWVVWQLPDLYESSTLIVVKPSTLPNSVVPTITEDSLTRQINSIAQVVTSRSSLEPLIQKYDLYKEERQRGEPMEVLIDYMRTSIKVEVNTSRNDITNGFNITYRGRNAKTTKAVTEELASKYINEQAQNTINSTSSAKQFIDQQVNQLKDELEAVDRDRLDFMQKNVGNLPSEAASLVGQLTGLREQQKAYISEVGRLQDRRSALTSQLALVKKTSEQSKDDIAENTTDPKTTLAMINGAAPAGASLSRTESGAFGASPSARAREFQSILDGNSSAATRTPNAFDTPATAPRSFAPSAAAPLPSLSAGFLSPASGQFTPSRAFEPAMKPQPGVLPFPTRR